MIPFGPWRPDVRGVNTTDIHDVTNVLPAAIGFQPCPSLAPIGAAVGGDVAGSATLFGETGNALTFAGTSTKLYKLGTTPSIGWTDVSRTSGGNYALAAGDKWHFTTFGNLGIATNITDAAQKIVLDDTGLNFTALGGSPPRASYIATVGDFVVLAALSDNARAMQWSAINNAEGWTLGTGSSDRQEFPDGGSIKGLTSGRVGYVFQSTSVREMVFAPGSPEIFQFRQVEVERGLVAPDSLVQVGDLIFFLAQDGFYRMSGGITTPIGAKKVNEWFFLHARADRLLFVDAAADPLNQRVYWAFVSTSNGTSDIPDKVLCYDWALDAWSKCDISIRDLMKFVSPGYNLDTLDSVANLDALPFSLDHPIWGQGNTVVGAFTAGNQLASLSGAPLAAVLETADFQPVPGRRAFVSGFSPLIDASTITARIGGRERLGDTTLWSSDNGLESTGVIPAHVESRYLRARVAIPSQTWTFAQGLEPEIGDGGTR